MHDVVGFREVAACPSRALLSRCASKTHLPLLWRWGRPGVSTVCPLVDWPVGCRAAMAEANDGAGTDPLQRQISAFNALPPSAPSASPHQPATVPLHGSSTLQPSAIDAFSHGSSHHVGTGLSVAESALYHQPSTRTTRQLDPSASASSSDGAAQQPAQQSASSLSTTPLRAAVAAVGRATLSAAGRALERGVQPTRQSQSSAMADSQQQPPFWG